MTNHDFDERIFDEVAHRPWPTPGRPWVMTQTWHDLLFAHWPVAPGRLRELVPAAFELDLFDGDAWLGIVPFRMTNVAPRGVPSLPWFSRLAELNVRTYVRAGGRGGVYFFSLDASRRAAVYAARLALNLPYHPAAMTVAVDGGTIRYWSERRRRPNAAFEGTARTTTPGRPAPPGSLEAFLTERYCLFNLDGRQRPYRLDIHHRPWRLQAAEVEIARNTMASAAGVALPDVAPLVHVSARQDMVAWWPVPA